MATTDPNLRPVKARRDLSKGTLPIVLVVGMLGAAMTAGGTWFVHGYRLDEVEKKATKTEAAFVEHDKHDESELRHVADSLSRLERALDRLEDRLGTKPAHE